jgi:probable HAF family extracellular repeat protein
LDATVVGYTFNTSNGTQQAFSYANGTPTNLGTLGGSNSDATAINASGTIVGTSYTASGAQHAFSYSNGTMTDIGALGGTFSEAFSINNSGEIVGEAANFGAFLYNPANGMEGLNVLYASLLVPGGAGSPDGFTSLTEATAINSTGDIAGYGDYWNGSTEISSAFLLEPATVPEPSTWALLLGGAGLLACGPFRQKFARASARK